MNFSDTRAREIMLHSIAQARLSNRESVHPFVGACLASADGEIIESAFRAETDPKNHCEQELFKKLGTTIDFSDTALFVTLEPCTYRNSNVASCSNEIINRGIKKVFIGIVDPNEKINFKGIEYMKENGVFVRMYDDDLASVLKELNYEFINKFLSRKNNCEPAKIL